MEQCSWPLTGPGPRQLEPRPRRSHRGSTGQPYATNLTIVTSGKPWKPQIKVINAKNKQSHGSGAHFYLRARFLLRHWHPRGHRICLLVHGRRSNTSMRRFFLRWGCWDACLSGRYEQPVQSLPWKRSAAYMYFFGFGLVIIRSCTSFRMRRS